MDNHHCGGFSLNTDGTNVGTLILRDTDASGEILVTVKSATSMTVHAKYKRIDSKVIYYSVSGTGCDVFIYEYDQTAV